MIMKSTHAKGRVGKTGAKGVNQHGGVAANANSYKKKGVSPKGSVLNDYGGAPNNENPYAIK